MMVLDSDFRDYYDDALAGITEHGLSSAVLTRRRDRGLSRNEAFSRLYMLDWPTMPYGRVDRLCAKLGPEHCVIVYRDNEAHGVMPDGSDPLVFASRDEALQHWPKHLCSFYAFNTDHQIRVLAFTHLVIGPRRFEIVTRQHAPFGSTPHAWASNRGSYDARVIREVPGTWFDPAITLPVWSVDYVYVAPRRGSEPIATAFDFNEAPILAPLGIARILDANAVACLIAEAMLYYGARDATVDTDDTGEEDDTHEDMNTQGRSDERDTEQ